MSFTQLSSFPRFKHKQIELITVLPSRNQTIQNLSTNLFTANNNSKKHTRTTSQATLIVQKHTQQSQRNSISPTLEHV